MDDFYQYNWIIIISIFTIFILFSVIILSLFIANRNNNRNNVCNEQYLEETKHLLSSDLSNDVQYHDNIEEDITNECDILDSIENNYINNIKELINIET